MADEDFEIVGRIVVDPSGNMQIETLNTKLGETQSQVSETGNATQSLGGVWDFVWGGIIVAGIQAAVSGITDFVGSIIDAASESQDVLAQVSNEVANLGDKSAMTTDGMNALAESTMLNTKYDDELVLSAEGILDRFTNVGKTVFPMVLQSATDLAAGTGRNLTGTMQSLGRILENPTQGLDRLRMMNIVLTDAEKTAIKTHADLANKLDQQAAAYEKAGKSAEAAKISKQADEERTKAQTALLDKINSVYGGSAAAAAKTYSGQMTILGNVVSNVKEQLGTPFLSVVTQAATGLSSFLLSDKVTSFFASVTTGLEGFSSEVTTWLGIFKQSGGLEAAFKPDVIARVFHIPPEIMTTVGPLIDAIKNLFSIVKDSAPMVESKLQSMGATIQKVLGPMLKTIVENATGIINTLADIWKKHGDEIMTVVTFVFSTIATVIGGAFTLISGIISGALTLISGLMDAFTEARKGNWQGAWDAIKGAVDKALGIIRNTINTILDGIARLFGTSLADLQKTWKGNWDALVSIVATIKDRVAAKVQEVIDGAKNVISGALDSLKELGRNLLRSLAQGIADGVGAAIDAVSQAVGKVVAAAKHIVGAKSPSTVFMEIGANVNQGFAQGIEASAKQPIGALAGTIDGMMSVPIGGGGGRVGTQIIFNITGNNPKEVANEIAMKLKLNGVQAL